MTERLIIKLPFEGFYESRYSGEIDHLEQMEAEHLAGDRQEEEAIPPELRLEEGDFASILFDVTDYSAAYLATAKAYVDAFDLIASEYLGTPLGLSFESMTSPRFYNYETDRIFAHIAPETVDALFARSAADAHAALSRIIAERFTSRSGFASFYETDLAEWLEKPVREWDHNELETLLLACLEGFEEAEGDTLDWAVFYRVIDCDGLYQEWSNAVDWTRFDAAVADKREELAEQHRADVDPDYVPPPVRCPHTIDLFTGREG